VEPLVSHAEFDSLYDSTAKLFQQIDESSSHRVFGGDAQSCPVDEGNLLTSFIVLAKGNNPVAYLSHYILSNFLL
jgi:hypothetical protein